MTPNFSLSTLSLIAALATGIAFVSCSDPGLPAFTGGGTGGAAGGAGTSTPGVGGSAMTGGNTGGGIVSASGGSIGGGGAAGGTSGGSSGGTSGLGGSVGVSSGGNKSAGGSIGSGGAAASGAAGKGGVTGSGGVATSGGVTGTGGAGSGSVVATGGITGTGGAGGGPVIGGTGGVVVVGSGGVSATGGSSPLPFALTSPDQAEGALFDNMYTCNDVGLGAGINPELDWSGAPAGTMSFAITFIDTTQGATSAMGQHWAAWNIPASAMQFPKGTTMLTGALMGAMQTNKYLAPCPSGNDMYEYTVYALPVASITLKTSDAGTGVANSAGVADVEKALGAITGGTVMATPLAKATLHGKANTMGRD